MDRVARPTTFVNIIFSPTNQVGVSSQRAAFRLALNELERATSQNLVAAANKPYAIRR